LHQNSPAPKPFTIYHPSDIPSPPSDITPHYLPYMSRLITLSAHSLWSPVTSHLTLTFPPISIPHVTLSYPSSILYLPSHTSNDPLAIYYRLTYSLACGPVTHAQIDTRSLKTIPVSAIYTPLIFSAHQTNSFHFTDLVFDPTTTITW